MNFETAPSTTTAPEASGTPVFRGARATSRRVVIVYVIDNMGLGGTELNAVRTAERLDRTRFEVRVVCLGQDGPLTERYRELGVPVVNMPIQSFYGWSMLRSGLRFVKYVRQSRADVLHAHDVYSNIFVAVWARLAGAKVVIASRRWWNSLPNRKLRVGNRIAFARSNAVLANSQQVARTVIDEGVAEERVWTITNFADDAAFGAPSVNERMSRRDSWGVPHDAVVIGCVARFHPVKDHVTLVHAFARLRARHQEVFLVLVGDGPTRQQVEALVHELGLAKAVHFTGELHGTSNHHRGFDISVLASRSEGFPNSLVEAMAAGNPVVATAVGGSVDAVLNESTGLLVPPGDVDALTGALERLVADRGLRRTFGEEALRRARQLYGATHVLSELETMYERLLAGVA